METCIRVGEQLVAWESHYRLIGTGLASPGLGISHDLVHPFLQVT